MKKIPILLSLILSICASAAPTPKIINGEAVSSDELYPWHAFLSIRYGHQICGGSLIAPRWILTAAHCVSDLTPNDIQVSIGPVKKENRHPRPIVDAIHVYPNFTRHESKALSGDIALLHLSEAQTQKTITLAAENTRWDEQEGVELKVLGWGILKENTKIFPDELQIVAVPLLQQQTALRACQFDSFKPDSQLCAGDLLGGRDSCGGDSGGALFRGGINLDAVQYGIVSYGDGCGAPGRGGVYSRVSHFIPWIKSIVGGDTAIKTVDEAVSVLPPIAQREKGDRALLIGVDQYYLPDLNMLRGPQQDVHDMAAFLQDTMGFAAEDIYILQGAQATRANIDKLVQEWLIDQSASDGRVWLYFSGHGAYLPDKNGDEVTVDSQIGIPADETILPYDTDLLTYVRPPGSADFIPITTNHILDDEIDNWVKALVGRQVTIVFDSCHSGTATRAIGIPTRNRSKSGILALNSHNKHNLTKSIPKVTPPAYPLLKPQQSPLDLVRKNVVFWSAVRSHQVAKDGPPGIFTQYFIQGARGEADNNRDGYVTYSELLGYIEKNTLRYNMNPDLEILPLAKLAYDIRTNKPLPTSELPLDVFNDSLAMPNPHGLKIDFVDAKTGIKVDNPPYCAQAPCPKYKVRVHTDRAGLLLLYGLSDSGEGQQLVPNVNLSDDFSPQWNAGETRTVPFELEMYTPEPGMLLAILLDPAEWSNYQRLDNLFAQRPEFDVFQLQQAISKRDSVLISPTQATEISFATLNILK